MRKHIALALALGTLALVAPVGARADHCTNIIIFSRPASVTDHNSVLCLADGTEDTEARVFPPASTGFDIRYTEDLGADVLFVYADVSGTLFPNGNPNNKRIKLSRTIGDLGGATYDSGTVVFPGGRTSMGCVTIKVDVPDDDLATTTWRTIGQTC
jgi:hypothetical protein